MLLYWYACIFTNTYYFEMYYISLKIVWWVLSNTSFIEWIYLVVHKILANEDFIVTDDLISWLFIVAFVHPAYVQIALIWGFTMQLILWKLVHLLWRYKLNEVCNNTKLTLTLIPDIIQSSKVVTTWQTDGKVYKLKPRLFYKFILPSIKFMYSMHFQVNPIDFCFLVWTTSDIYIN